MEQWEACVMACWFASCFDIAHTQHASETAGSRGVNSSDNIKLGTVVLY